ncbi:hypothetical protein [Microcella sp.]|uniref:hypothetical protein n=1 Tax=Microcella sp. TaxID=1913979 RepID=UPI00391C5E69
MEDSYEPAALKVAWSEYRDANPENNHPERYQAFRAGYRRGIAQGALLALTTFVHSSPDSSTR